MERMTVIDSVTVPRHKKELIVTCKLVPGLYHSNDAAGSAPYDVHKLSADNFCML